MSDKRKNPLALDSQLCFDLYSTSLAMTQVYKPLLEAINLTYTQYLIMIVLWEKNGQGLKEIANRLYQKPGAITPVVKRMEKEGLLHRIRNAEDERYMKITLTDKGTALKKEGKYINQCIFESCGMETQELNDISAKLKKLRETLHGTN